MEDGTAVAGVPPPADAGTRQTLPLPADVQREVSVRGVDEQGNAGPALVVMTR